jgi:hypothetical protein
MPSVTIDKKSWEAGFDDAFRGVRSNPGSCDRLSYFSGRVEGEADRLAGVDRRRDGCTQAGRLAADRAGSPWG